MIKVDNSADPSSAPVVWISGAGSGIGQASAIHAAQSGWRTVLSGRNESSLRRTQELIGDAMPSKVIALDVGSHFAVQDACAQIEASWGRIDALVLAAGLNARKRRWADHDMTEFDQIVATNLGGVAYMADAALPSLRRRSGSVVVVSSYSAWTPFPGAGVAYSASKSALSALVHTLNDEEAQHGVRACGLFPGEVSTDFLKHRPVEPSAERRAAMLTPADVGRAVAFVLNSPQHVRIDELVISPARPATST